jgi:hypothetical protein
MVVVDTSTSPETVKEYVYVTGVSGTTATVVRATEDAATYPAAALTSGLTVAAVASARVVDRSFDLNARYLKPAAALFETLPRNTTSWTNSGFAASGRIQLASIALPADLVIGHLAVQFGTGATSPTHWWFGLFDDAFAALAFTADQTTTAINTDQLSSLAIATTAGGSVSSFTTTYTGLYYFGVMQAASTPANSWVPSSPSLDVASLSPVVNGRSSTGQTTVPSFPFTATTPSGTGTGSSQFYAYVAA